jgi:hypothetical protein
MRTQLLLPRLQSKLKKPRLLKWCEVPALLRRLFEPEVPLKCLVCPEQVVQIYYGFGDASQDGSGFNMQEQKGDTVQYRFGQWCDSNL